ncbi:adenine-specific methyltransferase EcoRI family protein, partial [Porphyromonas somerae]|uniref:adenine-specific methyltransferase EcoRI family protein n=1 Tax=Porphyromonas somerae TaxID=322095 RepID=UPI002A813B73
LFRDKTVLLPCDDPEWSEFTRYFAQRFGELGLRKLISTSYAPESKRLSAPQPLTLFEQESPQYDPEKSRVRGKIFTLSEDITHDGKIDFNDLQWSYLEGDGDFRSEEVCRLRDEADIIITNPPFSLFRDFIDWIFEARKQFLIIGNMNAITYKNVFPRIAANEMWLGNGFQSGNAFFKVSSAEGYAEGVFNEETGLVKFRNCHWYTNLEHGRRHEPLQLSTIEGNLRYSRHKEIKGKSFEEAYPKYDNYDAIEVGFTDAIPSDYSGVMGVPISFLDKYCPEQFEIVGFRKGEDGKDLVYTIECKKEGQKIVQPYFRVLIRQLKHKEINPNH